MVTTETTEEYAQRMRLVRPFQFFGITPIWQLGEEDVEGFCHDEVVRQYHDTRVWEDGGKRVEQMIDAWHYAQGRAVHVPTLDDVLKLGALIEPGYNATKSHPNGEFRHENVYIGDRMGVFPPYIQNTVELLVARAGDVASGTADNRNQSFMNWLQVEAFKDQAEDISTVDEWYLAYEWIHPFRDGNGRSGKILHNWLGGTLDDPVLVPDYFGHGNN